MKNIRQNCLASSIQPKQRGKVGWYFKVLKWLSENGLSLDVCGRLCDLVTPRSASRKAVALAFIGPPRSACRVSWPGITGCLAMVSSNKALNRAALSASATHQPTTRFERICDHSLSCRFSRTTLYGKPVQIAA